MKAISVKTSLWYFRLRVSGHHESHFHHFLTGLLLSEVSLVFSRGTKLIASFHGVSIFKAEKCTLSKENG